MPRQLNIRSDRAYDMAHRRARVTGRTVTAVVEDALSATEPDRAAPAESAAPLTAAQQATRDILQRIIARARESSASANLTSDHGDLYDENGLPK